MSTWKKAENVDVHHPLIFLFIFYCIHTTRADLSGMGYSNSDGRENKYRERETEERQKNRKTKDYTEREIETDSEKREKKRRARLKEKGRESTLQPHIA